MRDEPGFLDVVLAAKRIANIVKGAEAHTFDPDLLEEPAERALQEAAVELEEDLRVAAEAGDYEACFQRIARFADVLDRFFVEVLVMDDNRAVRENRIALLQRIDRVLSGTARLTEMVVDRAEHRARSGAGDAS